MDDSSGYDAVSIAADHTRMATLALCRKERGDEFAQRFEENRIQPDSYKLQASALRACF
jgi:hypothetical protein